MIDWSWPFSPFRERPLSDSGPGRIRSTLTIFLAASWV